MAAIDWTASMQQTYEFYEVDPVTWADKRRIYDVESCTITRDAEEETLGHASMDCSEELGECYIRVYMIVIQNGNKSKLPLGTYIMQTPSLSFDGKRGSTTMDLYSPLLELKEKMPPIGYTAMKGTDIIELASSLLRENMRAPLIMSSDFSVESRYSTLYDDFTANLDDTWLSYISDLLANAYCQLDIDETGRILIAPIQEIAALQPVWTYDDSNSSILYPDLTLDRDIYGIPNAVEVIYSTDSTYLYSKVLNDDENSPISTVNRGREILYRDTSPSILGSPMQADLDEYAKSLLKEQSCLEYTVQYSHGYTSARVGDCVRLNYKRAGITGIKAKIIRQEIECKPGCNISETAIYTNRLWG